MSIQLSLDAVNRSFDGFKAINDLSLTVEKGELRAIIGPNGAGKTTMMDIITGKTRPDSGKVLWNQTEDLTRVDEAGSARLGIGRKFQKPTVFETQTVEANIGLALKDERSVWATLFHRQTGAQIKKVTEILELVKLDGQRHDMAADLSHGQKQWLEIGMLLAQEPRLLLVDEPAAGMSPAEREHTTDLLVEAAKTRSVVVVEHDMEFVRRLQCKVTVLHEGSVLAEGSLDHVTSDQRVIDVYLGRGDA